MIEVRFEIVKLVLVAAEIVRVRGASWRSIRCRATGDSSGGIDAAFASASRRVDIRMMFSPGAARRHCAANGGPCHVVPDFATATIIRREASLDPPLRERQC